MDHISIDNHPSRLLKKEWLLTIRENARLAETQKKLTAAQLALLHKKKWFLAIAPQKYGGLQWSFPEIVAFEEAIGWADGSMGWVFTLCSGAGWFGGFLDPTFANSIFNAKEVCLAGSGAPTGRATQQKDGSYLISGQWKYASGAPNATIFTANCFMLHNDQCIIENGAPKIQAFCFLRSEVSIYETWNEIGLVASAGHSFSVENLIVDSNRTFQLDISNRQIDAALYRLPFMELAAATIAANYAGMTIHFLEEFKILMASKHTRNGEIMGEKKSVKKNFLRAVDSLNTARQKLYGNVDIEWNQLVDDKFDSQNDILKDASNLTQTCRNIVNQLFPYCGLTIMRPDTAISQVWRDFQTGSQHALFSPE